jgi:hypothetical protein
MTPIERKKTIMRIRSVAAAASIATGLGLAMMPSASAEVGYYSYTNSWEAGNDAGGWSAVAALYPKGSEPADYDYRAVFSARGETLMLEDWESDGHHAKAYVKVYNGSGSLVDTDTFILPDNTNREIYNLGTPDGSGNIRDGYDVSIQVCMNGGCSQRAWGVA